MPAKNAANTHWRFQFDKTHKFIQINQLVHFIHVQSFQRLFFLFTKQHPKLQVNQIVDSLFGLYTLC